MRNLLTALAGVIVVGLCSMSTASAYERGYGEYGYNPSYYKSFQETRKTSYRQTKHYRSRYTFAHSQTRHRHYAAVYLQKRHRHAYAAQEEETSTRYSRHSGIGPRPRAWCGWFMRGVFGGGPEYNLAANWRHRGTPTEPRVGAVVVWPHHVGYIVGRADNGRWLVKSGNYANRVATVAMSLRGTIAVRSVGG